MSDVRAIHLPTATELETLRERATAGLDAWAKDWLTGASPVLEVRAVHDATLTASNYESLSTEAGSIWFGAGDHDRAQFGRAVLGTQLMAGATAVDEWAEAVLGRAIVERNHALCAAMLGASAATDTTTRTASVPAQLFAFGSGAVEIRSETLGLRAIADAGVWRAMPPQARRASSPLMPLERAVRGGRMRLEATFRGVDIELPTVLDMRVGDVLRLPQRLDEPLDVLSAGRALARAELGETDGHRAIQMRSRE